MKKYKFYSKLLIILLSISFCTPSSFAQKDTKKSTFAASSAGISLGWYNPSLDYWKEKSMFKDADFNGSISVRGFFDFQIVKDFHGQIGVGYWQSTAKEDLQGFGTTEILISVVSEKQSSREA